MLQPLEINWNQLWLISLANLIDRNNCWIQLLVVVIFRKLKQNQIVMMMQYTNCVVKAHQVQTVKLTPYKYKIWWHVLLSYVR